MDHEVRGRVNGRYGTILRTERVEAPDPYRDPLSSDLTACIDAGMSFGHVKHRRGNASGA